MGGYIDDVASDGTCKYGGDPGDVHKRYEITNQACLYKLWMCACWASQAEGCLCAKENPEDNVTIIKPIAGDCPKGSGPIKNPKAKDTGGLALKCAPNPCLACCACGKGLCRGAGDPADDDN